MPTSLVRSLDFLQIVNNKVLFFDLFEEVLECSLNINIVLPL